MDELPPIRALCYHEDVPFDKSSEEGFRCPLLFEFYSFLSPYFRWHF